MRGLLIGAFLLVIAAGCGGGGNEPDLAAGGEVVSLDAETGEELWRAEIGVVDRALFEGDVVLTAARAGDPSVQAIDASSGRMLWTADGVNVGDVAAGGDVALMATGTAAVAFDLQTGAERWRVEYERPVTAIQVMADLAFVMVDQRLHVLELSTGEERWSVLGLTAVSTDGDLVVGTRPARLEIVAAEDGAVVYETRFRNEPVAVRWWDDDLLLVGNGGWLFAFDPASLEPSGTGELWRAGFADGPVLEVTGEQVVVQSDSLRSLLGLRRADGIVNYNTAVDNAEVWGEMLDTNSSISNCRCISSRPGGHPGHSDFDPLPADVSSAWDPGLLVGRQRPSDDTSEVAYLPGLVFGVAQQGREPPFVGPQGRQWPAVYDTGVLAIDPTTGVVRWAQLDDVGTERRFREVWVAGPYLLARVTGSTAAAPTLRRIDAVTGAEMWSSPLAPQQMVIEPQLVGDAIVVAWSSVAGFGT